MDWMPQAVRDGIIVVLVISGPLVLAAAFIGLIIGVLQAATQVQEQTIGSALKIIGVFALIIFAGFWMYQYLNQYTSKTLSSAFTFVPRQTQKAVPSDAFSDEQFNAAFEGADKPIEVIKPEKLEDNLPPGGAPQGAPYLGAPEIPKPPAQVKLQPPPPPELPKQITKPVIPPSNLQEIKPIDVPGAGESSKQIDTNLNEDTTGVENGNIDMEKINLVPGKVLKSAEETSLKKQEQETVSVPNEENNEEENSPSWLN